MAFDQNDPADLAALKSEVNDDPLGMGYAAFVDTSTKKLMDLLNLGENNLGGETAGKLLVRDLFTAIDPEDLDAQQVDDGKLVYIQGLLNRDLSEDIAEWLPQIKLVFGSGAAATLGNLNSALRVLGRSEVLFGVGTNLSSKDWAAARDSS